MKEIIIHQMDNLGFFKNLNYKLTEKRVANSPRPNVSISPSWKPTYEYTHFLEGKEMENWEAEKMLKIIKGYPADFCITAYNGCNGFCAAYIVYFIKHGTLGIDPIGEIILEFKDSQCPKGFDILKALFSSKTNSERLNFINRKIPSTKEEYYEY